MPETQDWAAAPQTGVLMAGPQAISPSQGGTTINLGIAVAGQVIVLVGADFMVDPISAAGDPLPDKALFQILDTASGFMIAGAGISPDTPYAQVRPPFGSVRTLAGADLQVIATMSVGAGSGQCLVFVYYYLQAV